MIIKAVKLYDNGFMAQPFVFGGEEGPAGFDPAVKYRSSLQNFVIDTGSEIILVDTGLPSETPDQVPDENAMLYMGSRVNDYVSALAEAGYKPEQVGKILITHKHLDHTGELRAFPNAQIFASREETKADELQYPNVVPVDFTDGAYKNHPDSYEIRYDYQRACKRNKRLCLVNGRRCCRVLPIPRIRRQGRGRRG